MQRQLGGWQCSANPRAAAVGMCVVPPPSGPGTPLPSSWRAATHPRLSKAAPAGCPRGPSQEPPRARRGRLGAGGWTGTQVFLGFTWWPGRLHGSRLIAGAAHASRPAQFSSAQP